MLSCTATLGSVHCSESVLFSIKTQHVHEHESVCFDCRGMFEGLEITRAMQPKPWAGNTAEAFWTQGFPLAMVWGSWEDLTFPFIIGHETMYDFRAEGMGF